MEKKKLAKTKDVFANVEWLKITRNNQQLLLLEDREINGVSRTDLAKLIGNKFGQGTFNYTTKYFNDSKLKVGKITSLIAKGIEPTPQPNTDHFEKAIKRLEERIDSQAGGNESFKMIMEMKDQAYKIQIEFWKSQCDLLKSENEKLKKELESEGSSSNPLLEALLPLLMKQVAPGT